MLRIDVVMMGAMMSRFEKRVNQEIENGFSWLGVLAKVGWATGASIGNSIHQSRLHKAIEQERARRATIEAHEKREEIASKVRIEKFEKVMLAKLENDLI